jgi:hypothetical protein
MGLAPAFLTPARDALLNHVAEGSVQRTVVLASVTRFGGQLAGFLIASFAQRTGALPILLLQALVLAAGALALRRIEQRQPPRTAGSAFDLVRLFSSIAEGARTVFGSPAMRVIALQNCAMGVCFMGSYIVTLPLLIRDVHDGTSVDLAFVNAANAIGLVTTILVLMRFGDIRRQGRALLLAQMVGALALGAAGLGVSFGVATFSVFLWGLCGGIAMSQSRAIMQEQAPAAQRGRVMAFFSFAFMGSGPIGALVNGLVVERIGPEATLVVVNAAMLTLMLLVAWRSSLWHLEAPHPHR